MKKYKIMGALTILIIAVIYMLPRPYEKTLSGTQISTYDASFQRPLEVKIEGWYASILFFKDKFKGSIQIGDRICTLNTYITVNGDEVLGDTLYYLGDNGEWLTYGTLYTKSDFSELMILIGERNESGVYTFDVKNGTIVTAPSESLEEATMVAERHLKRSFFNTME